MSLGFLHYQLINVFTICTYSSNGAMNMPKTDEALKFMKEMHYVFETTFDETEIYMGDF